MKAKLIAASLAGLLANLAWPAVAQPDWAAALLVGITLARVQEWPWTIPLLALHDALLFGAGFGVALWAGAAAWSLPRIDQRIGPGSPQRFVWGLFCLLPLAWHGWSATSQLMSVLGLVVAWQWAGERLGGRLAR